MVDGMMMFLLLSSIRKPAEQHKKQHVRLT